MLNVALTIPLHVKSIREIRNTRHISEHKAILSKPKNIQQLGLDLPFAYIADVYLDLYVGPKQLKKWLSPKAIVHIWDMFF